MGLRGTPTDCSFWTLNRSSAASQSPPCSEAVSEDELSAATLTLMLVGLHGMLVGLNGGLVRLKGMLVRLRGMHHLLLEEPSATACLASIHYVLMH